MKLTTITLAFDKESDANDFYEAARRIVREKDHGQITEIAGVALSFALYIQKGTVEPIGYAVNPGPVPTKTPIFSLRDDPDNKDCYLAKVLQFDELMEVRYLKRDIVCECYLKHDIVCE
jgi:hypothetical protein